MDNPNPYGKLLDEIENGFPKVPESLFRQFIPLFFEPTTLPAEEQERLREEWLKLAIDPRLSVWVMSEDGKDRLFRVPPITYTTQVLTGRNIAGLLKEWALRTEASPMHGARFAEKHITNDLVLGAVPEEDVSAWREIMARYNIGGAGVVSETDVTLEDADDW
jgi:hypothetical protein